MRLHRRPWFRDPGASTGYLPWARATDLWHEASHGTCRREAVTQSLAPWFPGKTSLLFGKETPQGTPLGILPGPGSSLSSIHSELLDVQHKLPTTPPQDPQQPSSFPLNGIPEAPLGTEVGEGNHSCAKVAHSQRPPKGDWEGDSQHLT